MVLLMHTPFCFFYVSSNEIVVHVEQANPYKVKHHIQPVAKANGLLIGHT